MPQETPWQKAVWALVGYLNAYTWTPEIPIPPEADHPRAGFIDFTARMGPIQRRRFRELAELAIRRFEEANIPGKLLYVHLNLFLDIARVAEASPSGRVALPFVPNGLRQLAARTQPTTGSDAPDSKGYVESPADPGAYVPAAEIVGTHTPADKRLTVKDVSRIVEDHKTNHVRWTRPRDKKGKPIANRRSVHLGDWATYLKTSTGTDANGFLRQSDHEIAARKDAVRRAGHRRK